ncbi:hypothetical protein [Streptomyces sp. NPDC014623]|uniref:hypothetical protein n=1 Tax=Streptomyces sp. NPDC014623 TaxID=3364875 RepID=UPI0036F4D200
MRSARTLFASAAVTAVLAVSAPAAYAVTSADDWDKDSGSSASSNDDREKLDSWKHDKPEGKESDKESGSGGNDDREKPDSWKHDKPEGGVHAGGGALAGVSADDWQKDKDKDEDEGKESEKGSDKESGSGSSDDREKPDSWKHEKPEGGVHAGGGALAGVSADDWQKDKESSSDDWQKDKESSSGGWEKDKESGSGGWEKDKESGSSTDGEKTWKHEKPEGGVHTGGGAMALSGSGLAAGSVLMLGGLGAVAYKLRRRSASGATAV